MNVFFPPHLLPSVPLRAEIINCVSLPLCCLLNLFLRKRVHGLSPAREGLSVSRKCFFVNNSIQCSCALTGLLSLTAPVWILLKAVFVLLLFCNFLTHYDTSEKAPFGVGYRKRFLSSAGATSGGEAIRTRLCLESQKFDFCLMTHRIQWVSKSPKSLWQQNVRYRLDGECGQCFTAIVGRWKQKSCTADEVTFSLTAALPSELASSRFESGPKWLCEIRHVLSVRQQARRQGRDLRPQCQS